MHFISAPYLIAIQLNRGCDSWFLIKKCIFETRLEPY